MLILVRREQEKYFYAETCGKLQCSKTSRRRRGFKIRGFFFRSQQLTYKIVYTCIDVISSEEDTMQNAKHLSAQ